MARRTSPKVAPAERSREVLRAETATPPRFHFRHFAVTRALFQELPKVALQEGEKPTERLRTNVTAKAMVGDKRAEVRFSMTLLPDPHTQPYEIQVEVVGAFSTEDGSDEQLGTFCRVNAPAILFPYMRELVNRISADGRYGPIRLNPVNIAALLKEDDWVSEQALLAAEPPTVAPGRHPKSATHPES
jgi:preprotein translocase subunit SecB